MIATYIDFYVTVVRIASKNSINDPFDKGRETPSIVLTAYNHHSELKLLNSHTNFSKYVPIQTTAQDIHQGGYLKQIVCKRYMTTTPPTLQSSTRRKSEYLALRQQYVRELASVQLILYFFANWLYGWALTIFEKWSVLCNREQGTRVILH